MISRSPLLSDDDLIERVRDGKPDVQIAIAGRPLVSTAIAAAIAEVGSAKPALRSCKIARRACRLRPSSRSSRDSAMSPACAKNLLARDDLPMSLRQALLSKLSQTLAGFVVERQWLGPDHAEYAAREACEKATVALAADTPYDELGDLVRHLRQSGQLTAGMLLRALLSGNVVLLEESLAELSELAARAGGEPFCTTKRWAACARSTERPGCPNWRIPAFRDALAGLREGYAIGEPGGAARLKRRLTERVLMLCSEERCQPSLLALLRRFRRGSRARRGSAVLRRTRVRSRGLAVSGRDAGGTVGRVSGRRIRQPERRRLDLLENVRPVTIFGN